MKLFKLTDILTQAGILVGSLVFIIIPQNSYNLINLYFIMGGWQVLSLLIHSLFAEGWLAQKDRRSYGKTILWTFITGILCYLSLFAGLPLIMLYLFALLIVSPMFAVWYFIICVKEWRSIKMKELIHLK
ncbi:MAG: hypothetical protein JNM19_05580 [Chitinophagaceae bacterium]|nr:hypothetical protein [Chitinophagaceae bacterium]